jgi:hypothetical protein
MVQILHRRVKGVLDGEMRKEDAHKYRTQLVNKVGHLNM